MNLKTLAKAYVTNKNVDYMQKKKKVNPFRSSYNNMSLALLFSHLHRCTTITVSTVSNSLHLRRRVNVCLCARAGGMGRKHRGRR